MVTVIPLLLFAMAATRIPLSLIGIMQYISPSMQFLLGLLIYHEAFDIHRLVGFCCVWVGLLIFILEGTIFQRSKKLRLVEAANVTEG